MKRNPALPLWTRALAISTCLGLSGGALAASTVQTAPVYQEELPSEPSDPTIPIDEPTPVDDSTLLAPEPVVHAMELYEAHPEDTVTGSAQVESYLQSLPSDQYGAYVGYFEQQAQSTLQAAEERYTLESQVDPGGALQRYQDTLSQTQGYEGTQPQSVPTTFESVPLMDVATLAPSTNTSLKATTVQGLLEQPVDCLAQQYPDGSYQEICDGGGGGGGTYDPPPPPPPPPPPSGCSSYTDRFGQSWSRCDGSPVAYVYLHGAGNYRNYSEASHGYWGWSNLAGTSEGSDRFFVSWDATQSVQSQAGVVRQALDTLCSAQRPCVLVTHSAGGLMMGYILSQGNRWNILRIHSIQSAAGGSELANLTLVSPILWIVNSLGLLQSIGGYPIYSLSLPVPIARGMYNHDVTNGVPFITYASEQERGYRSCKWYQVGCHLDNAWSSLVNGTLRGFYNGGSDWLVAYHSSSAFRFPNWTRANTSCNPDAWMSPGGYGTPYFGSSDRMNYYWANHTPYHWQPSGQGFACRRGYTYVEHSGWHMLQNTPRAW